MSIIKLGRLFRFELIESFGKKSETAAAASCEKIARECAENRLKAEEVDARVRVGQLIDVSDTTTEVLEFTQDQARELYQLCHDLAQHGLQSELDEHTDTGTTTELTDRAFSLMVALTGLSAETIRRQQLPELFERTGEAC